MGRRRLSGTIVGTATDTASELEINAQVALEIDGATTRLRVANREREIDDPQVARWAARLHAELQQEARVELRRREPCTPIWKPARSRRRTTETVVCPDCDGIGCASCGEQGWRVI